MMQNKIKNEIEVPEIGERIRYLCRKKRMSYQELAEQSQISLAALYNLMSGKGNPTLSTLNLICKALDMSLGQLLSYERYQTEFDVSDEELKRKIDRLSPEKKRLLKMYLDLLEI